MTGEQIEDIYLEVIDEYGYELRVIQLNHYKPLQVDIKKEVPISFMDYKSIYKTIDNTRRKIINYDEWRFIELNSYKSLSYLKRKYINRGEELEYYEVSHFSLRRIYEDGITIPSRREIKLASLRLEKLYNIECKIRYDIQKDYDYMHFDFYIFY